MTKITLIFFLGILLNSCIKNNPEPSWIEIDKWVLEANPSMFGQEGILTQNLTDAWVYVNGETIGVFELPVKIPILASGNSKIQLFPAIKNNGISATKKVYPFLEPFSIETDLIQNEVFSILPKTQYYSSVKFNIENFDGATNVVVDGVGSLVSSSTNNDPTILNSEINGTDFLRFQLDATNNFWAASTKFNVGTINMPLPIGKEVYLELDYYNTNKFVSGVLGIGAVGINDNSNVQMNPQDPATVKWKKIYIDLREVVSGMSGVDYYEFSFNAQLDENETSGFVCIDNIKAVYF